MSIEITEIKFSYNNQSACSNGFFNRNKKIGLVIDGYHQVFCITAFSGSHLTGIAEFTAKRFTLPKQGDENEQRKTCCETCCRYNATERFCEFNMQPLFNTSAFVCADWMMQ